MRSYCFSNYCKSYTLVVIFELDMNISLYIYCFLSWQKTCWMMWEKITRRKKTSCSSLPKMWWILMKLFRFSLLMVSSCFVVVFFYQLLSLSNKWLHRVVTFLGVCSKWLYLCHNRRPMMYSNVHWFADQLDEDDWRVVLLVRSLILGGQGLQFEYDQFKLAANGKYQDSFISSHFEYIHWH